MAKTSKAEQPQVEPVKAQEQPKYITRYKVDELVEAAKAAFNCSPIIAKAALRLGGKEEYSMEEANKIISEFRSKEVKK